MIIPLNNWRLWILKRVKWDYCVRIRVMHRYGTATIRIQIEVETLVDTQREVFKKLGEVYTISTGQWCGSKTINFGSGSYQLPRSLRIWIRLFRLFRILIGVMFVNFSDIFYRFSFLRLNEMFEVKQITSKFQLIKSKMMYFFLHVYSTRPNPWYKFRIRSRNQLVRSIPVRIRIQLFRSIRIRILLCKKFQIRICKFTDTGNGGHTLYTKFKRLFCSDVFCRFGVLPAVFKMQN